MNVENIHRRIIPRPAPAVGELLDTLSSPHDRLWPKEKWPAMRLDRPLGMGAKGGHGPVRYFISEYEPGRRVRFTFTAPSGFDGFHEFDVTEPSPGETVLRHTIRMKATGRAMLSWSVIFRPLHDALIEDLLDKAEVELGLAPEGNRYSGYVRALRFMVRKARRMRKS